MEPKSNPDHDSIHDWHPLSVLDEAELYSAHDRPVPRSPAEDYRERFCCFEIHEAERFHCNSRINRTSLANQPLPSSKIKDVGDWMDSTNYAPDDHAFDFAKKR